MGGAVAEAAHRESGVLLGVGFEVGEAGGLGGLGDLGCDDVEDPAADPAEVLGPELPGAVDEVRLGQRHRLGVHRGRQQAERAVDHPRLRQRRGALAHRRRQDRPVRSRASARRRSARASAYDVRVCCASRPRHPSPRCQRRGRRRRRGSATAAPPAAPPRPPARQRRRLHQVGMNVGLASRTALSTDLTSQAAARIGCDTQLPSTTTVHRAHARAHQFGRRSWRPGRPGYYSPSQLALRARVERTGD